MVKERDVEGQGLSWGLLDVQCGLRVVVGGGRGKGGTSCAESMEEEALTR